MQVNSLGINYSAIPAKISGRLQRHANRLVSTDFDSSVMLAQKALPEMTLGALSHLPYGVAKDLLIALPEQYLSRLFSLESIWPEDAAAFTLKQNFGSNRIAAILEVNGMQTERRARLIKKFSGREQFNIVLQMLPHAAGSVLSSNALIPQEILLMYESNFPQLAIIFPRIEVGKALSILAAMRDAELAGFISSGAVNPGLAAGILARRTRIVQFNVLDNVPDAYAAEVLRCSKFPLSSAAEFSRQNLLSRNGIFPLIDPPRLLQIFTAMDKLSG